MNDFEGKPIDGGIKALETKFGTKWRVGDQGYQRAFSKMKMIVEAVDKRSVDTNQHVDEVLADFDEAVADDQIVKLSPIFNKLRSVGLIPVGNSRKKSD